MRLYQADIRAGLPEIADESVDWIVTDPPYLKNHANLFDSLGAVAARVLRRTGGMLCMCGHAHLIDFARRIEAAAGDRLFYYWTLAIVYGSGTGKAFIRPGGVASRGLLACWKPVLMFVRDKRRVEHRNACDFFYKNDPTKRVLHKWQQSVEVFRELLVHIIPRGATILDPFLGSGTTAVACRGRYEFIGCDIDLQCIETTQTRLKIGTLAPFLRGHAP